MHNVTKTRLQLSSLSVSEAIMKRSVVKAFYKLLLSLDKQPDEFLNAYGDFYSLISERNCSDNLAYSMTEAALFDENCFTRAAAGGKYASLPQNVLNAVKRDCEAILSASALTPDDILQSYKYYDEIKDIVPSLPRWEAGECAPSFKMFDGSLDKVAQYYKENGCGIFARYKALFGATAISSLFCIPTKSIWIHLRATSSSVTWLSTIQSRLLRAKAATTVFVRR